MHEWVDKTQRYKQSETTPTPQRGHTAHNRSCNTVGLPFFLEQPIGPHGQKPRVQPALPTPSPGMLYLSTGRIHRKPGESFPKAHQPLALLSYLTRQEMAPNSRGLSNHPRTPGQQNSQQHPCYACCLVCGQIQRNALTAPHE